MASKDLTPHVAFCIKNKILVYPVLSDAKSKKYKIEASIKGKKRLFEKEIAPSEINDAMDKTYKYYYDKFNKE